MPNVNQRAHRHWTMADVVKVQGQQEAAVVQRIVEPPAAYRPPYNHQPFGGFSFRLPWAPSVNHAYANAGKGRMKSAKVRQYASVVSAALMAGRVPCNCLAHPLAIHIVQHASSDRGDPDNGIKVVLDCMKRYGVIADDNRSIVKEVRVSDGQRVPAGSEFIEVRVSCVEWKP